MMETADRRAIVNGYGCGGEGGGGGRFVSWLCAKIHPPKEGVSMVIMVDDGSEKIKSDGRWTMECVFPSCFFLLAVDFEKTPKSFFRLGAPFLSEFEIYIQKEEMFEL